MVGERGPEMVEVGPNGIRVVPNHKLPSWLRSSAGALGAVNMGLRGFGSGTSSPWDDIMAGTPMIASASGVKKAGKLEDYLMMIAATLAPATLGSRAVLGTIGRGIGRAGGSILDFAGSIGAKAITPLQNSKALTSFENWWMNVGKAGYTPGPAVNAISKLAAPQIKLMEMADQGGWPAIAAAAGFLGLTAGEATLGVNAPGFLMDLLTGGPKKATPPMIPHAPGRSVSGTVNIHNPQLNSAADIDRLAERVAQAQTRALRSSGYVKR
jgi:hypothetical protein